MKEKFQQFCEYTYAASAGKFLASWCRMVMKMRIEPMKKKARMLRAHHDSYAFIADLELGYIARLPRDFNLIPAVGVEYI